MNVNEDKYKAIHDQRRADPNIPLSKLCQSNGVSYQSYNSWFNKYKKSTNNPDHKVRITVQISVSELARLVSTNIKTYPIEVSKIVRGLEAADKSQLALELGNIQMDRFKEVGNA